jgi:DNA modification methylase
MTDRKDGSAGLTPYAGAGRSGGGRNPHPTVKPVALMRYLLRLVVPAGGVVIDPFLGSGTTGMAAVVDGYRFIGIEREEKYLTAADARIRATWAEVHA